MKKVIATLLAATLLFSFAGCGKENTTSTNSNPTSKTTSEKNVIFEKSNSVLAGKDKKLDKMLSINLSFQGNRIELLDPLETWFKKDNGFQFSFAEDLMLEPYDDSFSSNLFKGSRAYIPFEIINNTNESLSFRSAPVVGAGFNQFVENVTLNGKALTDYSYEDIYQMFGKPKDMPNESTFEKEVKRTYKKHPEKINEKRGEVSLRYEFNFEEPFEFAPNYKVTAVRYEFSFMDRKFDLDFEKEFYDKPVNDDNEDYEMDYTTNHITEVYISAAEYQGQ